MKTQTTYGVSMLFLLLVGTLLSSCKELEMKNSDSLTYFFDKPAKVWEETFPLGNGRLGLMPDGGISREKFVLNEISLWSGSEQDTDNPNAYYALSSIRRLLFEGKNDEAQDLMYQTFVCKGAGSGLGNGANVPYGSFQLFGNLTIDYTYESDLADAEQSYRRELDLSNAIATTTFRHKGVNYIRESFASFSDDIGVIYLSICGYRQILEFLRKNRSAGTCRQLRTQKRTLDERATPGRCRYHCPKRNALCLGGTHPPA